MVSRSVFGMVRKKLNNNNNNFKLQLSIKIHVYSWYWWYDSVKYKIYFRTDFI